MQTNNLQNYYKTHFQMVQNYGFSFSEIENLMPWERDVYIDLIKAKVEEESKKYG